MHNEDVPDDVAAELQAGLDKLNESDPPAYSPTPLQANFRHLCLKARQARMTGKGVSTAIDLKEVYATGWSDTPDEVRPVVEGVGEYAILYREGKCKSCKEKARSREGRIVVVADRPPVLGRVGRE